MRWLFSFVAGCLIVCQVQGQQAFQLAPAVAVEAEDFHIESGWKVIKNGHGNYMVDMIGFNHISGQRLLGIDEKDIGASAFADITVPQAGAYRLWVRYEYPPFSETRFRVVIEQNGRSLLDRVMGTKKSLRYGFGDPVAKAQYDPAWGPEGLLIEAVDVPKLKAGKARIYLKGAAQPQQAGISAHRNIDLMYLTGDTDDAWRKHYTKQYPLLDAFRDSLPPRYEVRFTNRGDKFAHFNITHAYNRIPWGVGETADVRFVEIGAKSDWVPLRKQDTAHFGMVRFSAPAAFDVEIRPAGGAVERKLSGTKTIRAYLPPYPGKGEKIITPIEEIDAVLAELKKTPIIGKKPTKPLCYGGWMPVGLENDYGRKYAQLYAALGFRSLHSALSGPAILKNLKQAGVPSSKSWAVGAYRNPPTLGNIERAKQKIDRYGGKELLRFFDYGDEIGFGEWMRMRVQDDIDRVKRENNKKVKPINIIADLWVDWLKKNRPNAKINAYWLDKWGPFNSGRMRPDSSAEAAASNPRLYVDSILFYEETAIRFVAEGRKKVKEALGQDVLCGGNYSCHPFYYPHSTMYVKWFRDGAADFGRHSGYFWQVAQAGPMINGYIAEHFRAGMRDNPKAVLRQYNMPHAPGNTDANFLRSAFTHLAHGATMLDFFGIGMNETFTENHIAHRDHSRYRALRDVTHAIGFVEDRLPQARAVASPVALLLSASTERWDFASVAADSAGHNLFGPNFRKTRLNSHLDRFGLWTALTFQGASPDLIMEEDVNAKGLKNYQVLILVGDSLPPSLAPAIEKWVSQGGVVLATANAGRYDPYRQATPVFEKLFGLQSRKSEERQVFFRPRQELAFLKPHDRIACPGGTMPQIGTFERITPRKDATVLARFQSDKEPAIVDRHLGKGHIFYVAALPGVGYLWSALQPPLVPDRGLAAHAIPTHFNEGARSLVELVLRVAHVRPTVEATPALVDARLLKGPGGYILPIANYHDRIGQKITLRIRVGDKIGKVASAYHGELAMKEEDGRLIVTIPALRYGDVLRLEVAK